MNVTDTFNRADNASSLGTTSDGKATWVTPTSASLGVSATFAILTNQARSNSPNSLPAYVETGGSDGTIQVDHTTSTGHEQLMFRLSDGDNYWLMGWEGLFKVVGNAFTTMATWTEALASGTRKVVLSGSTIQCYVNGTLVATVTDAFNKTATKHGICASTGTDGRWDNFSATTGVTFVQEARTNPSSGSAASYTVTLAAGVTAGNSVVLGILYSANITSISGVAGTWTKVASFADSNPGAAIDIWWGTGLTAGQTTVTVTVDTVTRPVINLSEWSGINSVIQSSGSVNAAATSGATPAKSPASADAVYGAIGVDVFGATPPIISGHTDAPSAWTGLLSGNSQWMTYEVDFAYLIGPATNATRTDSWTPSETNTTLAVILSAAAPLPTQRPKPTVLCQAVRKAARG